MQVFKLYFKILRNYSGVILMYIGIFLAVLIGIILPQQSKNETESYKQSKSKFAIFDYDDSGFSKEMIKYLSSNAKLIEIKDDAAETIQDELYMMNIHCAVILKEGFAENIASEDSKAYMDIYTIPNTTRSMLFEQELNSYLSAVKTYVNAGFELDEAAKKAEEVSEKKVEVGFISEVKTESLSPITVYFKYLSWIFICVCVSAVSVTLIVLDKKNVRDRIECSPYKFVRMNLETILGVLATGALICAIVFAAAYIFMGKYMQGVEAVLYMTNAVCIMAVALAITFMVSKLTDKSEVVSLMSNIIGLGMAFLCGVFVPLELISDTVIKIANFLPVYWYVKAVDIIDGFETSDLDTLLSYMGIQLLFAIAIMCVGMMVARRKRVA